MVMLTGCLLIRLRNLTRCLVFLCLPCCGLAFYILGFRTFLMICPSASPIPLLSSSNKLKKRFGCNGTRSQDLQLNGMLLAQHAKFSSKTRVCAPSDIVLASSSIGYMHGGGGNALKARLSGSKPVVQTLSSTIHEMDQKEKMELSKAERELWRSKRAILGDEGPFMTADDEGLSPEIYHNLSRFIRSYDVMEELFRIYIYKDGYKPLVHQGYRVGIYASEGLFIDALEQQGNHFVVDDPSEAHMFFLPYSVKQMVFRMHDPHTRSMKILRRFISNYVDMLISRYPFWNRTQGRDHFFVSCHDWALRTLQDHVQLRRNIVKVVCNADVAEGFDSKRDVSLPETYIHDLDLDRSLLNLGGTHFDQRPYLAFFAGQMHGDLRPLLIKHWKGKHPSMKIFEVLPSAIAKKLSYVWYMKNSKFCICPRGFDINSPRLVESIYYDCVPAIISDNFVLPFSEVLDWSKFSLTVLEKDVPNLKNILESISAERYKSMQNRLKYVRRHFLWHKKPVKYDIFNMIMHSLWNQRLRQL